MHFGRRGQLLNPTILKWVVLPLLAIGAMLMLLNVRADRAKCHKACVAEGFVDARYVPQGGRYNTTPEQCFCLTAEEASVSNRIPAGTQIY